MLIFFDYCYFHLYNFYSGYNDKSPGSAAGALVGGFLAMNIITIMMFILWVDKTKSFLNNRWLIVGIAVLFQIITYVRYEQLRRFSYESIREKVNQNTESKRKLMRSFSIAYGILSPIICFALAIYLGSKNN